MIYSKGREEHMQKSLEAKENWELQVLSQPLLSLVTLTRSKLMRLSCKVQFFPF